MSSSREVILGIVCVTALFQFSAAGQVSRPSIDVPARYNSVQMSPDAKKAISFTVENTGTETKDLNVSLGGVNASFEDGASFKDGISLDDSKDFTVIIQPQSEGTKTLRINATNRNTLLTTSRDISVVSRDLVAADDREVPGLTQFYILLTLFGALAFFWFSRG